MEEKVLFTAARAARGGEPLELAARLRVDHGAIAALLVPTPTPALVGEILSVLVPHNRREEEPGGVYDACDEALGPAEAERLAEELRAFPEPPLKPYNDGPEIQKHIEENLALARRQWAAAAGRGSADLAPGTSLPPSRGPDGAKRPLVDDGSAVRERPAGDAGGCTR